MTSNKNTIELSFNGKVQQGHEPYFQMGPTEGNVRTLIVKSVAVHHMGIYTCVEENGQGDYHLIYLTVTKAESTEPVTSRTPTLHRVSSASTQTSYTDGVSLIGSAGASYPVYLTILFIVFTALLSTAVIGLTIYVLCTRRKIKKLKKGFKEARAEEQACLDAANRNKEVKEGSIDLVVIENQAKNNTADNKSNSSQHAVPTTSEDHTESHSDNRNDSTSL
jgi:hypothetical protein